MLALVTKLKVVCAPGNASAALCVVKRPPIDVNRLHHREGRKTSHSHCFPSFRRYYASYNVSASRGNDSSIASQ